MLSSNVQANEILAIKYKEAFNLSKKNIVYFVKIKDKKVKDIFTIRAGILEYKSPRINLLKMNNKTNIIIYSKVDNNAFIFAKELKTKYFSNVRYLLNGQRSILLVLNRFRGIKLFSIFGN